MATATSDAETASLAPLMLADSEAQAIEGHYVVMLKEDSADMSVATQSVAQVTRDAGGTVDHEFLGLGGFSAQLNEDQLQEVRKDDRVLFVEQDFKVSLPEVAKSGDVTAASAPWGLDRVDGDGLDGSYTPPNQGSGVHAYVIDTGVSRHSEFSGRLGDGIDYVDDDSDYTDGQGHGTHVAGTIAGSSVGLAPGATIHGVRVLDNRGSGSNSDVVAGMDWVAQNAQKPAVANLSLGGPARGGSSSSDQGVKRMMNAGVVSVMAAGNDSTDACGFTPAREASGITVASSDRKDSLSSFSNYGRCVDIIAPGSDIKSASFRGGYEEMSGTSMAAPHVAGGVALYLAANPNASASSVEGALQGGAQDGAIRGDNGTINKLLNVSFISGGSPGPAPEPGPNPNPGRPAPEPRPENPDNGWPWPWPWPW